MQYATGAAVIAAEPDGAVSRLVGDDPARQFEVLRDGRPVAAAP